MIFPALTRDVFLGAMVRDPFFGWDWDLARDLLVVGLDLDLVGPWAILLVWACL